VTRQADLVYAVDERPPWPFLIFLGARHAVLMSVYLVLIVIVFRRAEASHGATLDALSLGMVALAISTVLQAIWRGPVGSGVRLDVVCRRFPPPAAPWRKKGSAMDRPFFLPALLILVGLASGALAKGSPGPPSITITGRTDFGSVLPHKTASLTLSIKSSGYLSAPSVPAGGPFSILSSTCTGAVKACTAIVEFAPPLGGDYSAPFTAYANRYYRKSVTLTGHGYGPSYSWVTPVYLYNVPTGTAGTVALVLNSSRDTPLRVVKFAVDARGPLTLGETTCLGHLIAPKTSCTVDVRYNFDETDPGSWVDGFVSATTNSGTSLFASLYIEVGGTSN
jgi:hypothetical protein